MPQAAMAFAGERDGCNASRPSSAAGRVTDSLCLASATTSTRLARSGRMREVTTSRAGRTTTMCTRSFVSQTAESRVPEHGGARLAKSGLTTASPIR